MRISDWSSDVCSSDLAQNGVKPLAAGGDTLVAGLSLLVLVVVCQVAPPIPPLTRASANSDRLRKECTQSDLATPLATMKWPKASCGCQCAHFPKFKRVLHGGCMERGRISNGKGGE